MSIFVNLQPVINPSVIGAKAGVEDFITEVEAVHNVHLGKRCIFLKSHIKLCIKESWFVYRCLPQSGQELGMVLCSPVTL